MKLTRRNWITLAGGAAIAAALPRSLRAARGNDMTLIDNIERPLIREHEQPMFDVTGQISAPVRIASVELLRNGANFFVRTRSTDGAEGLITTKQMAEFVPLFACPSSNGCSKTASCASCSPTSITMADSFAPSVSRAWRKNSASPSFPTTRKPAQRR